MGPTVTMQLYVLRIKPAAAVTRPLLWVRRAPLMHGPGWPLRAHRPFSCPAPAARLRPPWWWMARARIASLWFGCAPAESGSEPNSNRPPSRIRTRERQSEPHPAAGARKPNRPRPLETETEPDPVSGPPRCAAAAPCHTALRMPHAYAHAAALVLYVCCPMPHCAAPATPHCAAPATPRCLMPHCEACRHTCGSTALRAACHHTVLPHATPRCPIPHTVLPHAATL